MTISAWIRQQRDRLGETLRHMTGGSIRAFAPEHDDYPKTGMRPLKDDLNREHGHRNRGDRHRQHRN